MLKKKPGLSFWIFASLIIGIIVGWICHSQAFSGVDTAAMSKDALKAFKEGVGKDFQAFNLLSKVFLSLVKVIIAPLVFSLLLVGLVKSGSFSAMGRIGLKTILYFTGATLIALAMGLIIVNLTHPGDSLPVTEAVTSEIKPKKFDVSEFVLHIFPSNIIEAMAKGEILQIIVFTIFFAAACSAIGNKAKVVIDFFDAVGHIMLKFTGYVMYFAPFAVFGAVSYVITLNGVGALAGYAEFVIWFLVGLLLFIFGVLPIICAFLRINVFKLYGLIREPMLIAFGTASSEAAMPKTIDALEKFGCSDRITGFVLPLGYSFNLDGSIMYMTFATVSIAQAYGMNLSIGEQLTMMLMLLVSSKGMAGVPRASLVVIAGMLSAFNIPAEGITILFAVDWLLDMGRSATNVAGNAVATAVICKWENELKET